MKGKEIIWGKKKDFNEKVRVERVQKGSRARKGDGRRSTPAFSWKRKKGKPRNRSLEVLKEAWSPEGKKTSLGSLDGGGKGKDLHRGKPLHFGDSIHEPFGCRKEKDRPDRQEKEPVFFGKKKSERYRLIWDPKKCLPWEKKGEVNSTSRSAFLGTGVIGGGINTHTQECIYSRGFLKVDQVGEKFFP